MRDTHRPTPALLSSLYCVQVHMVNLAQGGGNLQLPFFCLDKQYKMKCPDGLTQVPDLWLIDTTPNWTWDPEYRWVKNRLLLQPALLLSSHAASAHGPVHALNVGPRPRRSSCGLCSMTCGAALPS
jgi:hypothetical protein